MADSNVPITAGSGTNIDTFTQASGDHRQAVVVGDASAANVAGVAGGGLAVNGGALAATSGAVAAGTSPVTVGPLDVTLAGNVTFVVRNTTAATSFTGNLWLLFEQSDDNVSWSPLVVARANGGSVGYMHIVQPSSPNAASVFEAGAEAINYARVRVINSNTSASTTIDIQAGGMAFPTAQTLLSAPLDGHRDTFVAAPTVTSSTFAPHLTATAGGTQPFLILQNPANSPVRLRVLRCRLEMTIATAALLTFGFLKNLTLSTGGTSSTLNGKSTDAHYGLSQSGSGAATSASPSGTSVASVLQYTAAPTANSGMIPFATRRLWVGLNSAAGAPYVSEVTFGVGRPSKALILDPGQQFCVSWGAAPATAVTLNPEIEWTEELTTWG